MSMEFLTFFYTHWVLTTWFLAVNWGGIILTVGAAYEALNKKG